MCLSINCTNDAVNYEGTEIVDKLISHQSHTLKADNKSRYKAVSERY